MTKTQLGRLLAIKRENEVDKMDMETMIKRIDNGEDPMDLCIEKWEALATGEMDNPIIGTETCALCHLYWHNPYCEGCPVAADTDNDCCDGTPYEELQKYIEKTIYTFEELYDGRDARLLELIQEELEYLQELKSCMG